MISNRALAILLILIIVPTGAITLARFLPVPPRRDQIPAGAYVVPWMQPNPSISYLTGIPPQLQPWNLSSAMAGALTLDTTFTINTPNYTRVVPSIVYLGHDLSYLYVGGIFTGMYANPFTNSRLYLANYFQLLLDTDNDGKITQPEAGSYEQVNIPPCPIVPNRCDLGSGGWGTYLTFGYEDLAWRDNPPFLNRSVWDFAQNMCSQPFTDAGYYAEYNNVTGTLALIFARSLAQPSSCANALQMQPGDRWVMSFLLELGFFNPNVIYGDFVGGWPLTVYPYINNDASSWPKLVIDLANPPRQFTGQ